MNIIDTNVTVMVKDMDASITFYEQIGLSLKSRWGNNYAMMTAQGVTLGLHPGKTNDATVDGISIGFIISDINDAKQLFDKSKIAYQLSDDKSGIFAHTKDPNGVAIYFMQPKYGKPD